MQVKSRAAFYIQPPLPLLLPLLQLLMLLHPFATFITLAHFPSHAPPYCAALLRRLIAPFSHLVCPCSRSRRRPQRRFYRAARSRQAPSPRGVWRRHSAEFD